MIEDMLAVRPGPVVVLIGAPGAGKSTFAATFPSSCVLNLDAYREMVSGDAHDQGATEDAVRAQYAVLKSRLRRGLPSVLDSTNLRERVRADLLHLTRWHEVPALAVVFTISLETCLRRNAARPRPVPEQVVRDMHALTPDSRTLMMEGFAGAYTITED
jgi:predicted kinase